MKAAEKVWKHYDCENRGANERDILAGRGIWTIEDDRFGFTHNELGC